MTVELAVQLGLLFVLVATAATLSVSVRTRRYRQRIATLAQIHGLKKGDAKHRFQALPLASILEGRTREFKIAGLLVGEDEHGRFFVARRSIDLYSDQILCFETSEATHVADFRFAPYRRPGFDWRRLFSRGRSKPDHGEHRLEWTAKRSRWADTASLGFGARVVGHVARICGEATGVPLAVEIHESKILIHSNGAVRGEELNRFFQCALLLRRTILNARRHAHSRASESSRAVPTWGSNQSEDVRVEVIRG